MDCERLVVENLPLVDSVVRQIARRHRLSADEAEELAASIRLKLVEKDYEVVRKFEGRSQLRTYLVTVVQRHFLDTRNARWGRWRPSAIARRLGPVAVLLDRLLTRDHVPFEQAVGTITSRFGDVSRDDVDAIVQQLPARSARRFVGEEELENVPAESAGAADAAASLENEGLGDRVERALENALAGLGPDDRWILSMRFCETTKVARIAELLGVPAKPFYRRMEDLLRVLRKELEAQGIRREEVAALIGQQSGAVGEILTTMAGKMPQRPSVP